ncbi:bifunctional 4-hydroxy-2-oxoglutarate aldolase/2-dehydro-3-deoxy-phosphogluconate aldolase [Novipirellula artificiosorum]|uniref:2-dehydro-3-deoxy-phosphogluconate aldolase n=1 Tax=Novipirellula artificiosorum TaxID=2528016 RepID=A0A5C6E0Y9_9BACT|nr:bifunctional 4-hydroxy-2-oxoglutarate aldolase/2-dehydro-3-deoxy-phosphogluconate aldolase [Novipirellula artificiosorum]TWU42385.1 putative KHG/KDPG aldolase [Novipirellula artificiosorum]
MNHSEIALATQATIQRLRILPVIAIERVDDVSPLADALDRGGLPIAEITLRTDAGLEAIAKLSTRNEFVVGAGTIHSVEQAKMVADAGAKFVVSPGFNPRTVQWCLDHQMPIYPGVSFPTDLETALEFGLEVVKFFPAEQLGGVKMIQALQGPYGNIRFIPTGGISAANLKTYLDLPSVIACGAVGCPDRGLTAASQLKPGDIDCLPELAV